jgi:3-methyladenine DNA glycosylase AlkD
MATIIMKELQKLRNPAKARILQSFFKTGKGEYGEGDIFLGISVPDQRKIAQKNVLLSLSEIKTMLQSPIHEYRLTALLILTYKPLTKEILDFYLQNTKYVNNWDLVDLTAYKILGNWLLDKNRFVLYKLAKSKQIWEQRIAIVATYAFIKNSQFEDTIKISKILLSHKHDLIHKAVGWMLREVGKRDEQVLRKFLNTYKNVMPRTMLRYAIERLPDRKLILNKV